MSTREKFKRRIIELIHGLPYEEAIEKEGFKKVTVDSGMDKAVATYHKGFSCTKGIVATTQSHAPITIGRVMQALGFSYIYSNGSIATHEQEANGDDGVCDWELTKENGQEADDDFQSDSTIKVLYDLIKKD